MTKKHPTDRLQRRLLAARKNKFEYKEKEVQAAKVSRVRKWSTRPANEKEISDGNKEN